MRRSEEEGGAGRRKEEEQEEEEKEGNEKQQRSRVVYVLYWRTAYLWVRRRIHSRSFPAVLQAAPPPLRPRDSGGYYEDLWGSSYRECRGMAAASRPTPAPTVYHPE